MIPVRLDPDSPAVRALLALSDAYTLALYPDEIIHFESAENLKHSGVYFIGIHSADAQPVACGAVKICTDTAVYGEIKRLFVIQTRRGLGLSKRIMHQLEAHLKSQHVHCSRLVTGSRQTEALALYESLGYTQRGAFGTYRAGKNTVFMEKSLTT